MTKKQGSSVRDLSIAQAKLFEELKNRFYETNYVIQNLETSTTEQLKALNAFHKKLIGFEQGLLALREQISQYE